MLNSYNLNLNQNTNLLGDKMEIEDETKTI